MLNAISIQPIWNVKKFHNFHYGCDDLAATGSNFAAQFQNDGVVL